MKLTALTLIAMIASGIASLNAPRDSDCSMGPQAADAQLRAQMRAADAFQDEEFRNLCRRAHSMKAIADNAARS